MNIERAEKIVTETVGGEAYRYIPLGEYVVRAVGVCAGRPTFKYTRVEIAGVMDRIADGESIDEIATGFDGYIKREAIAEAVTIARQQCYWLVSFSGSYQSLS